MHSYLMENPKIIEIIYNFGGKRFYEEKKLQSWGTHHFMNIMKIKLIKKFKITNNNNNKIKNNPKKCFSCY